MEAKLPAPVLQVLPRDPGRDYCDVCEKSWVKRGKKHRVYHVDGQRFKNAAETWQKYQHSVYNQVYSRVDWFRKDLASCKDCRSVFFKETYMKTFPEIVRTMPLTFDQPSSSSQSPNDESLEQPTENLRSSSRKRCRYETNRLKDDEKKCIICNGDKTDKKGHILPVVIITLRTEGANTVHLAEQTLIKFAKIHQKHQTLYKEAAERIFVVRGIRTLFSADVRYHRDCYIHFRGKQFELLEDPINSPADLIKFGPNILQQDSLGLLLELVRLHIVCRKEVYLLADLRKAYEDLKSDACPVLRVGDVKLRILEEFPNEVLIQKSSVSSRNQEYVFPASVTLTPDVLAACSSGFGLSKTATLRSAANRLHHDLIKTRSKRPHPPTPQDIKEDKNPFNADTFNLIAWIVEPSASIAKNGLVNLQSKCKALKVGEVCRTIESLLPNAQPSLDQILYSLMLHRKTGSREIIDIAHAFGYGVSYTETCFIEDKWAEWDRSQNSNIPSNIKKKKETTVVTDNIDYKNKNISGEESHHTNIILIQHSSESTTDATLRPNYSFDRKTHKSFKAAESYETSFNCPKVNPAKFNNEENVAFADAEYVKASKKTIAWLLCRLGNAGDDIVPAWSALQSLTSKKPELCEVTVGYHPAIRIYVVDAMKIVRMIPVTNLQPKTFLTWTKKFLNYITNLKGTEIHIVFDQYSEDIDLTRPSKGRSAEGEKKYVSSITQVIPSNGTDWVKFQSNSANKCRLVQLITDYILSDDFVTTCPIYVTKFDQCVLKCPDGSLVDVQDLTCTHKEADPRLALHAVYASRLHPGKSVAVVSDDTDVYIILLSIAKEMEGELYFRQGKSTVGKGIEYHNVTSLAALLGEECCRTLPAFHALTGCDFTYPFFQRSKIRAFSLMINLKKAKKRKVSIQLLRTLGSENVNFGDIIDFILHTVYNRPAKENTPKDSRLALLHVGKGKTKKCRSTKLIPPDESSLRMKIKRCNLVAYPWVNCLNTTLQPLVPVENGWKIVNDELVPVWFEGNVLPSDEEYDAHVKHKLLDSLAEQLASEDNAESEESDCDYESDDYPASEADSDSSDEDAD